MNVLHLFPWTLATAAKAFRVRYSRPDITSQGLVPRSESLDTISVSLYYSFF